MILASKSLIPLVVIGVYLGLLLLFGLFSGRLFRRSSSDFFLASRSIGPFLLLMSVFGTTMTAFALVGSTGKSFSKGIGVSFAPRRRVAMRARYGGTSGAPIETAARERGIPARNHDESPDGSRRLVTDPADDYFESERFRRDRHIVGDPEFCARELCRYRDHAGIENVILRMQFPGQAI